jgi:hypothetical protein
MLDPKEAMKHVDENTIGVWMCVPTTHHPAAAH